MRRVAAEFLGTAFLLAGVVGSGIMAAKLAGGNGALALLCNTLPTGALLTVLILTFGPLSGAHFNPAVSMAMVMRRELPAGVAATYIAAQIVGGIVGVLAAHVMFELPLWQLSATVRTGPGQWAGEFVATLGLLLTIVGCAARTPAAIPYAVGLYITAAYWFTASTSFANPAVTVARALSDTYAGIAAAGVPAFIVAQLAGACAAVGLGAMAVAACKAHDRCDETMTWAALVCATFGRACEIPRVSQQTRRGRFVVESKIKPRACKAGAGARNQVLSLPVRPWSEALVRRSDQTVRRLAAEDFPVLRSATTSNETF